MRIDGTRIGSLAATMLVNRIENGPDSEQMVDVGFNLIERDST
jgi:LacI family gluconate utilization system Gnt-I transcriptional repressor